MAGLAGVVDWGMPTYALTVAGVVVVVCIAVAAGVVARRMDGPPGGPGRGDEPRALVPNTAVVGAPREGRWWRERHKALSDRARDVAASGDARIVFLGDSITQGWDEDGKRVWERYYAPRGAVNMGISGDKTQHVIWRVENGNLEGMAEPARGRAPELVVVLIGTNNVPRTEGNTAEQIGAGVVEVVRRVRERLPRTKVLVMGILPRGDAGEEGKMMREKIRRANEIAAGAADGEWVRFLDLGDRFLDEDGGVRRDLMPDLLHLSEKGYEVWAEGMEGVVREVLGEG